MMVSFSRVWKAKNPTTKAIIGAIGEMLCAWTKWKISGKTSKEHTPSSTPAVKPRILWIFCLFQSANKPPKNVEMVVMKTNRAKSKCVLFVGYICEYERRGHANAIVP